LRAGETVVVTGAGGGVGMVAVDVARHFGGRVIAAVGSDRHTVALRERGVSEIVNYSTEKLPDRLTARAKPLTSPAEFLLHLRGTVAHRFDNLLQIR
jgi:NADPH2:quinone reductase